MSNSRKKITFISECGINHNGSVNTAKKMIDFAADAGSDYVKFQVYKTENLLKKQTKLASYQIRNTKNFKSQFEMLKNYELSFSDFEKIFNHCKKRKIKFLATPFDHDSLFFLDKIGIKTIKLSSGDITNSKLIYDIANLKKKIIFSTGMADIKDIDKALIFFFAGLKNIDLKKNNKLNFFQKNKSLSLLKHKVSLLHCTSSYPAKPKDLNLNSIQMLSKRYDLEIGYSDHSEGIHLSIAAIALGATIIEKHFTLNKGYPGPDHKASIDVLELKELIKNIRDLQNSFGSFSKKPSKEELNTSKLVRKGLYAKKKIKKNTIVKEEDIDILRPENSCSPTDYWRIIGKRAKKDYEPGDSI